MPVTIRLDGDQVRGIASSVKSVESELACAAECWVSLTVANRVSEEWRAVHQWACVVQDDSKGVVQCTIDNRSTGASCEVLAWVFELVYRRERVSANARGRSTPDDI